MRVVYVSPICQHVVHAQDVNWMELVSLHAKLEGQPCPTCGRRAHGLQVIIDQDDLKTTSRRVEEEVQHHETFKAATPPAPTRVEKWLASRALAALQAKYPISDFSDMQIEEVSKRIGRQVDRDTLRQVRRPGKVLGERLVEMRNAITGAWGHGQDYLANIPVGVINYTSPNALTVRVVRSRLPFVVVDFTLMTLLYHLAKATMASIPAAAVPHGTVPSTSAAVREVPAELCDDEAVERFGRIGLRYFIRDQSLPIPYTPLSPEKEAAAAAIAWNAEAFVLAHELGHALMGHSQKTVPVGRGEGVPAYQRSQQQEREADDFACTVMAMKDLQKEGDDALSPLQNIYRLGPAFTFALFTLIERTAESRQAFLRRYSGAESQHSLVGFARAPTHPPTHERLGRVKARMKQFVPGSGLKICDRLDELVEMTAGKARSGG